jgi:hypothetical protein
MVQVMHETDAILLAGFDDEPRLSSSPAAPGLRPIDRPRPKPLTQPRTESIALVVVDSDSLAEPPVHPHTSRGQPFLPFDICLFDPKISSYLVVYSAGTPFNTLSPRTISLSVSEAGAPITSLVVHSQTPGELHPVPYLTFQFAQDIRGKQLTLRFTNSTDPQSLAIDCEGARTCFANGPNAPLAEDLSRSAEAGA